jgi:hypothetical protein
MTRDPAEFEEIELAYQKALADLDEVRRVFASQRTFENLVIVRKVWSRKWNLKMIEMLARKCPEVELETLMDMVFKVDAGALVDPKAPKLTMRYLDEIDDVRLASKRLVEEQLAKAKRSACKKRKRRKGRVR